jgi:predicted Zn-dependent protease
MTEGVTMDEILLPLIKLRRNVNEEGQELQVRVSNTDEDGFTTVEELTPEQIQEIAEKQKAIERQIEELQQLQANTTGPQEG